MAWWKWGEFKAQKDIRCVFIFFLLANLLFAQILILVGEANWLWKQWKYLVAQHIIIIIVLLSTELN